MIKEAYVSFEVAKLLKEKGFDWSCGDSYVVTDKIICQKPTHQMAMAWLREVCNVYMDIAPTHATNGEIHFVWQTYDSDYSVTGDCDVFYPTYEEAVEAALKYSLENLI